MVDIAAIYNIDIKIMTKGRKKLTKTKRRSAVGGPLILHADPASVRREHIQCYRQQVAALNSINKELKNFEEREIPAFHRWFGVEFAPDHEILTTLHARYQELDLLCDATQDYRLLCGGSYVQAFAKVSAAHAEGKLIELMQEVAGIHDEGEDDEDFEDDEEEDFWGDEFGDENSEDDQDTFDYEKVFREFDGSEDHLNHDRTPRSETDRHFKNLYRKLVRKLHPDFCLSQTTEEKELWHELQDAYEWNDIDKLEKINQRLNGAKAVGLDLWAIPIGDIVRMTKELTAKLKIVQRDIVTAKKTDYWDFEKRRSQKSFLAKLTKKIRSSIEYETTSLRLMIIELENQLERWRTPRKKARPKKVQPKKTKAKPVSKKKGKATHSASPPPKAKDFWTEHFSR